MAGKLKDSVVVITGASSGIGRAAALRFAKKGAAVVLAARREQVLKEVAEECLQAGGRALVVAADVTDEGQVRELARRAVEEYGRIDVWVNNAAVSLFARFEEAPPEEYDRVIDTNLLGYVRGMRAVLPVFREQGYGTIINNASVFGKIGSPYVTAYTTSKFGIVGLSESLRQELVADKDIHVSTLLPASIDTPIFQHAANYMGRKVKPLRPVYDADVVAKAIVGCARKPQRERIVGGAGRMLWQQRLTSPALFEKMQARMVDRDHFEQAPAEPTSGNVNEPVAYGTAVSGGWPSSPAPIAGKLLPVLAVGGVAAALAVRSSSDGRLAALTSKVEPSTSPVTWGVNPVVRSIRDAGLSAWFGGSLMGVAAVNRAVSDIDDPADRLRTVDAVWDRWTVPGGMAIAAHLLGSAVAGWGNKSRVLTQRGMASQMAVKGAVSLAALASTVAARVYRKQAVRAAGDRAPVMDATTPTPGTPAEVARAQRRLRAAEYAVPALTGAVVVLNAKMSEDQRPVPTLRQVAARLNPLAG
ncbi:MAG TPA: SDR family oxidoreductase [Egibacteraceae bacterium]|nr:SDR family oxidoreductase [Egibacteraceae bacterium]